MDAIVEGPNLEFTTETHEELLYDKQKVGLLFAVQCSSRNHNWQLGLQLTWVSHLMTRWRLWSACSCWRTATDGRQR